MGNLPEKADPYAFACSLQPWALQRYSVEATSTSAAAARALPDAARWETSE
jgi:hypothetical protein